MRLALPLFLLAALGAAQTNSIVTEPQNRGWRRALTPYSPRLVAQPDLNNTPRIRELMRAGNLYLSLADALALAVENNLDIELQRYSIAIAGMDLLRAQGGGTVRGLLYTIGEAPSGIGGPSSPINNNAASRTALGSSVATNPSELGVLGEPQTNLSVLGTIAQSNGTALPSYDPFVSLQYNWLHQTTPQTNSFTVGASSLMTTQQTGNAGFTQGFSSGAAVNVAFTNTNQSLNSQRTGYDPFTTSSLGITVTQPLLRGFGPSLNKRFIRIARNQEKITSLLFQQQLIATIYGVTRLYTDLVALAEDVKVKEDAVGLAQKLLEDTQAEVDEGTQAPIELTRAKAQISASRQDLINARGLLEEQEAILKTVLTKGVVDPSLRAAHIVPTGTLAVPEKEDSLSPDQLISSALRERPDLAQAGLQVSNSAIYVEGSRNGLRPELDLVGIAQNNALAGDANRVAAAGSADPRFIGGYGSVLDQIFTRKNPTYGIGISLTLPIRNRIAQADAARDELQLRQSQIRQKQLENQVRLEVEDALIALRRARAAYEAAMQTRLLQEESLAAEQTKYSVGASTSFFVIQYQSLLTQARSTEVAAKSSYQKARAALQRATGSILEQNHIDLGAALRGKLF